MADTIIKFWRATGSGPLAEAFTPAEVAKIVQVKFRMSQASQEALSARHVSAAGDIFGAHFFGIAMYPNPAGRFGDPLYIDQGDSIHFAHPNAGEVEWGLEVAYEVFGGAQAQGLPDSVPKSTKGAGRKGGVSNG
jgi:hypothetical protein